MNTYKYQLFSQVTVQYLFGINCKESLWRERKSTLFLAFCSNIVWSVCGGKSEELLYFQMEPNLVEVNFRHNP